MRGGTQTSGRKVRRQGNETKFKNSIKASPVVFASDLHLIIRSNYHGRLALYHYFYRGKGGSPSVIRSFCMGIYFGQCFHDAGNHQYPHYDRIIPRDRRAAWYFCSHLSGGICKARQQIGKSHPHDRGDPIGYPIHYLWSVWSSFLCNLFALGILYVVRGIDLSYYDLATCYSYD